MNQPPPVDNSTRRAGKWLFVWLAIGFAIFATAIIGLFLAYFLIWHDPARTTANAAPDAEFETISVVEPEMPNFSSTNVVTLLLGEESSQDGLKHLSSESDGRTTIENIDGVACRLLNRTNKFNGFLYFTIHGSFKQEPLKSAKIEFEFQVERPVLIRFQYDGVQDQLPKPYKGAIPEGMAAVQLSTAKFVRVFPSNTWQTISFHATDAQFMNSQNGGADFRLEVTPPQIFVRRVTVTRLADTAPAK